MVAIATLLPKEMPSGRVLLVSVLTWAWMMVSLSCALVWQVAAYPALYLAASPATRSYWLGWLLRLSTLLFVDCHPLWRLRIVHGQRPLSWSRWWAGRGSGDLQARATKLPQRLLIMVNHVSDLDPFITARALMPLEHKYVAKASLFSIPVGGWAMQLSGDVAVHFTSAKGGWGLKQGSVAVMFEECRRLVVEQHMPLLVFPEGTRDGTLTLKPFKKGMFDFAVLHGCSVLVMALDGPQRCWPFPGPFFDSGECRVAFGSVLPPQQDSEQLMADTRKEMQRLLDRMAQGDSAAPQAVAQQKRIAATAAPPSTTATTIPATSSSQ